VTSDSHTWCIWNQKSPSRNLINMTQDLQVYVGQCMLGILAPRLLVQCSLGSPGFPFPDNDPVPALARFLLLARPSLQNLRLSSLLIPHVVHSPSLPVITSWVFSTVAQSAATCSRWFISRGFFYPADRGDMFIRNDDSPEIYTAPHPRRRHSS
jgi:hypothetical protein